MPLPKFNGLVSVWRRGRFLRWGAGCVGSILRLPQLHVGVASEKACVACGACDRACPMSLPVSQLVAGGGAIEHSECIQCAACVDACKRNVLEVRFARMR